jgi:hypothetical protein
MNEPITLIYALLWLFVGGSAVILAAIIRHAIDNVTR